MIDKSLVQPAIRDERHHAYEIVYREQLRAIDLKPCLHYRIHPAYGTPVAPALIHLGRQFSLMGDDGWNLATSDRQRRDLIQNSILLHRAKGTPGGVEAALARAGLPSSRIHERLGSAALPASRHDGRFRHNTDILHDSGVVTPDRGWAIFGVSFDAEELSQARSRFGDLKALIETYKRACCHLAWLKPEQRLSDLVPKPWEGQQVEAKIGLRDSLLKGPFHDGAHRRGSCQRPVDAVHSPRLG